MITKEQIESLEKELSEVEFLSPNEPLTTYGVKRVLNKISQLTSNLEKFVNGKSISLTLWNPNISYNEGDVVVYFKEENEQVSVEQGKREFVFILISLANNNDSIPNYDIVEHIPVFTKSKWQLLNPLSYLLQNLNEMRVIVLDVIKQLIAKHVNDEHGLIGSKNIEHNIVKKDYSNLQTPWQLGKYSLNNSIEKINEINWSGRKTKSTNGIMEYNIQYGFDIRANQDESDNKNVRIKDRRYYYQKSPIYDESDDTIFCKKYIEENMFSVVLHENSGQKFNNLRYGTNIFFREIIFPENFVNDEYMVFFDTYGVGDFVFGYDRFDLESKKEPTYDAIVSQPMLMNKTNSGFIVVLPIHTYFNSMKKFNIGVPWKNTFRLQVLGRYR